MTIRSPIKGSPFNLLNIDWPYLKFKDKPLLRAAFNRLIFIS